MKQRSVNEFIVYLVSSASINTPPPNTLPQINFLNEIIFASKTRVKLFLSQKLTMLKPILVSDSLRRFANFIKRLTRRRLF